MSLATLDGATYRVSAPTPVISRETLIQWTTHEANGGGDVLGFDFPIGVQSAYASKGAIERFLDVLPEFGTSRWKESHDIPRRPDQSQHRVRFRDATRGGRLRAC